MFYISPHLERTGTNSLGKNFKTREPPYSRAKYRVLVKSDHIFGAREFSNPTNWSFYRSFVFIFEQENAIQTRSHKT